MPHQGHQRPTIPLVFDFVDHRPPVVDIILEIQEVAADDGSSGTELWKSDGTAAGTVLVKDINPGSGDSAPSKLAAVNGTLFFAANDGSSGTELWQSDGTEAGTGQVKDIRPGSPASDPAELTAVNGMLFFAANDGTTGEELWALDMRSHIYLPLVVRSYQ